MDCANQSYMVHQYEGVGDVVGYFFIAAVMGCQPAGYDDQLRCRLTGIAVSED